MEFYPMGIRQRFVSGAINLQCICHRPVAASGFAAFIAECDTPVCFYAHGVGYACIPILRRH